MKLRQDGMHSLAAEVRLRARKLLSALICVTGQPIWTTNSI
jgi:hypothetical protein